MMLPHRRGVLMALALAHAVLAQTPPRSLIVTDAATSTPVAGATVAFVDCSHLTDRGRPQAIARLLDQELPAKAGLVTRVDGSVDLPAFQTSALVAIATPKLFAIELIPAEEKFPMRVLLRPDVTLEIDAVDEKGEPVPFLGLQLSAQAANSIMSATRVARADKNGRAVFRHASWLALQGLLGEEPFAALAPEDSVNVGTLYWGADRWSKTITLTTPSPLKFTLAGPRVLMSVKDASGAVLDRPVEIECTPDAPMRGMSEAQKKAVFEAKGAGPGFPATMAPDGMLAVPCRAGEKLVFIAEDPLTRFRTQVAFRTIPADAKGVVAVDLAFKDENPSITGKLLGIDGKPAPSRVLALYALVPGGMMSVGSGASDQDGRLTVYLSPLLAGPESRKLGGSAMLLADLLDGAPVAVANVKFEASSSGSISLGEVRLAPAVQKR